MSAERPAFTIDGGDVLEPEPRAVFDEGAVFGVVGGEPVVTVAWREELPDTTLAEAVDEDLRLLLGQSDALLVDREPGAIGGVECVRTFTLHLAADGAATASEQWRLLAGGRRWTVSAMSTLADQPDWGPRLATVAATFRAG
jgi:hypothetical protein